MRNGLVATTLKSILLLVAATVALAQGGKKPLSVGDIERLLEGGVTTPRVATLVGRYGVDFEMTGATRGRLERAGADAELMAVIERAASGAGASTGGPEREPDGGAERVEESGSRGEMVFVSGGSFLMGCNASVDSECSDDERRGRTFDVAAFRIDKTEVTVEDYRNCVFSGRCESAEERGSCNLGKVGRDRHPINCVRWSDAVAYCAWRGKRLPSETEWEKAARGTDGRKYPWGNVGYGSGGPVANICDVNCQYEWKESGYEDGYAGTAPVGRYAAGASPYGALDMVGNVYEWTSDLWKEPERTVAANKPRLRVVRGGGWGDDGRDARASGRTKFDEDGRSISIGFRCAR